MRSQTFTKAAKKNNLATLLSLLICKNWKDTINAIIIDNETDSAFSEKDIEDFRSMVRFPVNTKIVVKKRRAYW